jgi:hypothetical protein
VKWNQDPVANPILQAGVSGMFDSTGIMDPSTVVFNDRVFVYYGVYAHGSNIGLATSAVGLNFIKAGQVMAHAGTPFPVINRTDGNFTSSTQEKMWPIQVGSSSSSAIIFCRFAGTS